LTDPDNVSFLIEITDNYGVPASDHHLIRSFNNVSIITNSTVYSNNILLISWQLDGSAMNAVTSSLIPTVPPVLSDFHDRGFDIQCFANNNSYFVRSLITYASTIPWSATLSGIDASNQYSTVSISELSPRTSNIVQRVSDIGNGEWDDIAIIYNTGMCTNIIDIETNQIEQSFYRLQSGPN
jgi:hypothetical protein